MTSRTKWFRGSFIAGIAALGLAAVPMSASAVAITPGDVISLADDAAFTTNPGSMTEGSTASWTAIDSFFNPTAVAVNVLGTTISVAFAGAGSPDLNVTLGDIDLDTVGYVITGIHPIDNNAVGLTALSWSTTSNSVTFTYDHSGPVGAPPSSLIDFTIETGTVPEPLSLGLLGLGLAGLGLARRRAG